MSRIATTALLLGATSLAPATASANDHRTLCEKAAPVRQKVIKMHGKRAPGRDICRWGVRRRTGVKLASTHQRAQYLRQLKQLVSPAPPLLVRTAGPPARPPAGAATASVRAPAGGTLAAIRQCESGGNYSTDTGNGFAGAYQFTPSTWASVGGSGNPAAASPAEQDRRAAMLYAREGSAPWPICGR